MRSSIRLCTWRELLKREDGSFTLEASMVFPSIFIALLALLLLSMYTYQHVILYKNASIAAERTAFRFDNSYRDVASGMGVTGQYDGLYWRMADNSALKSLFNSGVSGSVANEGAQTTVQIGSSVQQSSSEEGSIPLTERKLNSGAGYVREPLAGEISVTGILEKQIVVKLRHPMNIPILDWLRGNSEPQTVSSAAVVDPVELIRNVDLVRYYADRFNGVEHEGEKEKARQILGERGRSLSD
ncbi:hypothetical protein [Paenibacillus albus]|uniref:Pilus assembly protein n=1 Tax=Paenibacillus albus TaxID=2495582 RepID=A0A3Q8X8J7_9BACL|nr:hypothetical protein [Paenibacillus albus]AZN43005.1 hypothetical protein EJC50_27390 [Paenibacillus albus]